MGIILLLGPNCVLFDCEDKGELWGILKVCVLRKAISLAAFRGRDWWSSTVLVSDQEGESQASIEEVCAYLVSVLMGN